LGFLSPLYFQLYISSFHVFIEEVCDVYYYS
jgi:hypothetical protein